MNKVDKELIEAKKELTAVRRVRYCDLLDAEEVLAKAPEAAKPTITAYFVKGFKDENAYYDAWKQVIGRSHHAMTLPECRALLMAQEYFTFRQMCAALLGAYKLGGYHSVEDIFGTKASIEYYISQSGE